MNELELINELNELKELINEQNKINVKIGTQLESIIQTLDTEPKAVKRNYWQIVALMELIILTFCACLYVVKL